MYGLSFAHVVRLLRTYTAYLHDVQCGQSQEIRPILQVTLFLLSVQTLVIHGKSQGSNLEGSVDFFVRASCLLLLDSLEDMILRVPPSLLSARATRDSPYNLTS